MSRKVLLPKEDIRLCLYIDFGLCDRIRDWLGIGCPLTLALGTSELVRA